MYGVISSTTKKIKKVYGSIGSTIRNISKIYGIVGGVTKLIFSGDSLIKAQWTGVVYCQNVSNDYNSSVEAQLCFRTRTKSSISTAYGATCGSLYYTSQMKVSADGMYCAMYGNMYVQIYKWNGSKYAKQSEFTVPQLFTKAGITVSGSSFSASISVACFNPNGSVICVICNNHSSHNYRDVLFFKNDTSLTFISKSTCNETDVSAYGTSWSNYAGFSVDINSTIFSSYAYYYDQYYMHNIHDIYKINSDYSITRLIRSDIKYNSNGTSYTGGHYTSVDPLGKYVIIGKGSAGSSNSPIQNLYYISGSTATLILTIPTGYNTHAENVISSFDGANLYININSGSASNYDTIYSYSISGNTVTLLGTISMNYYGSYGLKALLNDDTHAVITSIYRNSGGYSSYTHFSTLTKDSNGNITAYTTDLQSSNFSNYFGIVDYEY